MAIYRTTLRWSGFTGAPGYTNFYFADQAANPGPQAARDRTSAFANAIAPLIPSEVQILNEGEVAVVDETTGQVTDYVMVNPDATPGSGGAPGGYSAASGAVITWNTAGVRNGRRVRGRTFIVPIGGDSYQNDGTLTPSTITTLNAAAEELTGATGFESGFCVFSRPSASGPGGAYPVTGHRVPDMAAVLRSRRD